MTRPAKAEIRMFVALAVLGIGAVWLIKRSLPSLPDIGAAVRGLVPTEEATRYGVGTLGGYVNSAAVGTVEGIGLAVGIPRTNQSQCDMDKAAGRWWDASFSCPAGDFVSSGAKALWPSTQASQATQADVRRVDNAIDWSGGNPMVSPSGMDYRLF